MKILRYSLLMTRGSLATTLRMSLTMLRGAMSSSNSSRGMVWRNRNSRPRRVTFMTTLFEKNELGMLYTSRSKLFIVVLYHPMSRTIPVTSLPLAVKTISSPTRKGLVVKITSPEKTFSRRSLPARPMASDPIPPSARIPLTSYPMILTARTAVTIEMNRLDVLSTPARAAPSLDLPLISIAHCCSVRYFRMILRPTVEKQRITAILWTGTPTRAQSAAGTIFCRTAIVMKAWLMSWKPALNHRSFSIGV
mmetsp:Transcript_4107/g.12901  ORF Transcript_4107/g.12901 Transcript_4107/m.12901 type:complete len:250 (+) Transcript_4107:189-938(+)